MSDICVRCTRCRNEHRESDRTPLVPKPTTPRTRGMDMTKLVCPRCQCTSFYDLTPMVAWCWASGLIEIGEEMPADNAEGGGAILVARGPKFALRSTLQVLAREGKGASAGSLLVPGVPEVDDQQHKADALARWLEWCAKGNGKRHRNGVEFAKERPQ